MSVTVLPTRHNGTLPLPLVPVVPNNGTRKPLRSWELRREKTMAVAQAYREIGKREPDFDRVGAYMETCGTFLEFAITTDQIRRLVRANFCDTRLCPMCSWRRSKKLGHELGRVVQTYQDRHPQLLPIMLTLTERNVNGIELGNALDQISKGFSKLRHQREWKRTVKASFRSTEVTRSGSQYHRHIHVLMFVSEEVSQSRWGELWEASRGLGYRPVVNVKEAEDLPHWAQYVTKEQDHLDEDEEEEDGWQADTSVIEDLHKGLKRKRLIAWSRELSEIRSELGAEKEEYVITHHEVYRWAAFTKKRGTYWLAGTKVVSMSWAAGGRYAKAA
jgi:hypothetical protein